VATSSKGLAATTMSSPSPSPTAAPTPQATEAAQRNAAAVAAAAAPPTPAVARISIPRIGIRNAPVYDRGLDAKRNMLIAPGYAVTRYAFSASFGTGNTFLYGHDDIQGNIFGHLYDLGPGDLVQISIGGETQVYRVTGHQIVAPTAVNVLDPTPDARLTIMTCWPFNVDTKRWIVTAVKA
jgi:sortase A